MPDEKTNGTGLGNTTALPELYQKKAFDEQAFINSYTTPETGTKLKRRDVRRTNRFFESTAGQQVIADARAAHDAEEARKAQASLVARNQAWSDSFQNHLQTTQAAYNQRIQAIRDDWEASKARWAADVAAVEAASAPALVLKDAAHWNQVASQYGFKDYNAVAAWQKEHGLKVDGKFGSNSYAKWAELNPDKVGTVPVIKSTKVRSTTPARTIDETSPDFIGPIAPTAKDSNASVDGAASTSNQAVSTSNQDALDALYYNNKDYTRTRLDDGTFGYRHNVTGTMYLAGNKVRDLSGATGSVNNGVVTWDVPDAEAPGAATYKSNAQLEKAVQDAFYKKYGRPYRTYDVDGESVYTSVDPEYERMLEEFKSHYKSLGWGLGYEYVKPELAAREKAWLEHNPVPTNARTGERYNNWRTLYFNAKKAGFRKQGGTMNRINYFQQGGAASQQDMQQQVVALVQAAMQGDQKATETVNKIMEAAKAGDQKALQIAQMIQEVAKQMQGQATAAKWGAKLGYIRSLKYAKGGKACPECEKKIEMKACGGKKALKK